MNDQTLPITLSHLEDEALYSYLGRANLSNCMGTSKQFVALAFGRLKAVISADLPSDLSVLLETAPQLSPYPSLEQIIELTTQYPYYRPFMSEAKWNELVTRATRGTGQSLKTWLGLPAHRFSATTMFRSCVMCDRTAWDTEGTFYWHRAHLLPGVVVCSIHGTPLVKYFLQSSDTARSALRRIPSPPRMQICVPASALEALTHFALTSHAALNSSDLPLSGETCRSAYLAKLADLGLATSGGRIHWGELSQAILEKHRNFEHWPLGERIAQSSNGVLGWLFGLLRPRSRFSHPVTHIVLINFLFESFASYAEAVKLASKESLELDEIKRIAAPPTADGLSELVLTDDSLSCRTAAKKLGLSVTTVVKRRRILGLRIAERRKSLTPKRISDARGLLAAGTAPMKVSDATRLSLSSVYRIRATLALPSKVPTPDQLTAHRAIWLASAAHGRSVRERRALVASSYALLYRHDRAWLLEANADKAMAAKPRTRVNWEKRDELYAGRIRTASTNLRGTSPRGRISRTFLMRAGGPEASIRGNVYRLPLVREALDESEETVEQFQRFRYSRAIVKLRDLEGSYGAWKPLKLAGLRKAPGGFEETTRC
ncbi:TnsD family Tn7-like transposition protein [Variovorax sp. M-6]|uniref:TnsD family Tn7-like transposition protein n=1 Tax=Variovorax sp. M-6 TaxID=3233041 RepID=UPI003F96956D